MINCFFSALKQCFRPLKQKSASVFPDLSNQFDNYSDKNIDQEKQH